MKQEILQSLRAIEQEFDVKILYACESGSRSWGFSSQDSDYDVRFFYIHHPEVYVSIDPIGIGNKRDVIERPVHGLLDVNGWDITKALKLFRKSNPLLLEWLSSAVVYEEPYSTAERMRELRKDVFSPASCIHHYAGIASNNYKEINSGDKARLKTYLYALRSILAAKWVAERNEIPPLSFQKLLAQIDQEPVLREMIEHLLQQKTAGGEITKGPRIPVIDRFLETEIEQLRRRAAVIHHSVENPTERLNRLFRATLEEVWKC
ncbi:nucleotidyltransferase domain-containing protein [Domibacillus indicus]|uniref:nucleotidyltransferase domain-containing protein n=1 Tax=Domibacillus indicus TaxID=1437523 RepID=UPI000617E4B9|nr:nucleotidyltransferase domain-containing protein [Domibacillus indicus]